MGLLRAGLDEVGWGSLAGDLVSVVVVVREQDIGLLPKGVNDSKRTSTKTRDALYFQLCDTVFDKGLGVVHPWEIDELGPSRALQESYTRALAELRYTPDVLIVDGSADFNKVQSFKGKQIVEPKADYNHQEVSIASMIGKVFRDRGMVQIAKEVKDKFGLDYGWAENKGYGGAFHTQQILKHGLMIGPDKEKYYHRKSYCKKYLK
jgi:ribonuclease HII